MILMQSVKLILLVVLFSGQLTQAQDGAFDVDIADYPYAAFVEHSDTYSSGNGAIISDTHVLTEASTLGVKEGGQVIVYVGNNMEASYTGPFFQSKNFQRHPMFNSTTFENNVAIVTIDGTFKGLPNVKPIGIRIGAFDNPVNCFIVGWEFTFSGTLERINYQLVTDQACASNLSPVPSSIQCASSKRGYRDFGSGGTPLICHNQLYGIQSRSLGDSFNDTSIDPFTKLSSHVIQDFIFSIVPRPNYLSCPCTSTSCQ